VKVTAVVIYPFETVDSGKTESHLLAYADVTLDGELTIKGFKLFKSKRGGLFVGYPSQKGRSGNYFDLVIPLNKELESHLRGEIVQAYKNFTDSGKPVERKEESP
jgi:DNA-binding cell septation regulator SpoVG